MKLKCHAFVAIVAVDKIVIAHAERFRDDDIFGVPLARPGVSGTGKLYRRRALTGKTGNLRVIDIDVATLRVGVLCQTFRLILHIQRAVDKGGIWRTMFDHILQGFACLSVIHLPGTLTVKRRILVCRNPTIEFRLFRAIRKAGD
ncbi:Uncharacterised protein [Klebsiella pneumoniae]|nr:Uncharacterised protein [Klebsiella pneumoniae]